MEQNGMGNTARQTVGLLIAALAAVAAGFRWLTQAASKRDSDANRVFIVDILRRLDRLERMLEGPREQPTQQKD